MPRTRSRTTCPVTGAAPIPRSPKGPGFGVTLIYAFPPRAKEEFEFLPLRDPEEFDLAIQSLREHPFRGGPGFVVEKLRNAPGLWKARLRHPHRRAYYRVEEGHLRLLEFGPRASFYLRPRDTARVSGSGSD